MNLFRLNNDPVIAAQEYQDIHCKKIIVEAAQLLANCYSLDYLKLAPLTQKGNYRKYSYYNHPISIWVRSSKGNFDWAIKHAIALCEEFEYRFGKKHFCESFIKWCSENRPDLVLPGEETEQPQCFGSFTDLKVLGNPVEGYKKYYKQAKRCFFIREKSIQASWTRRNIPMWFKINE